MNKTIYLIRHSETLKDNQNILNCNTDESDLLKNKNQVLSVNGEHLAQKMSEMKEFNGLDEVWSSDYVRAISTAKYLADKNNVDINVDSMLGERIVGVPKNNQLNLDYWMKQFEGGNFKCEGGESRNEVSDRMYKAILKIIDKSNGLNIAIVTHGAAITFLLLKWCTLISADSKSKRRHIKFNGTDVIDDKFNTPEVFKLIFDGIKLISIERILT